MRPSDIVQQQLDAYNARDIDAFCAAYSKSIRVIRHPSGETSIDNLDALRSYYVRERFNLPDLHATLVSRIEFGNKVIDHEHITGLAESVVEAVAIYEVESDLIQTIWFLESD
jgi:hypothetical protein